LILRQAEKWLRRLFVLLAVLASGAAMVIVVLVGASVTMRHIAQAPFRYTEELVGLLMTAAFFLALPLVTLEARHVRVQIVVASLPSKWAGWLGVLSGIFGVVFTFWFFWLCLPWFEFAYQRSIKTEAARLLMYPWMAILPLSMLLTSIAFAVRMVIESSNCAIDQRKSTVSGAG
jgi:TRAP-type C4-dicarboxylate transport system permease small subunit